MAKEKEPKTELTAFRGTRKEFDVFRKAAKKSGMSLSQWLRQAAWEKVCEDARAI